jgi:glutathione synthase/RimK-type ligase-like ATP-grasp enzyme
MNKIGILYGMEETFPIAIIEKINNSKIKGITAELIKLGTVSMNDEPEYSVILDRVTGEVPYYLSYLKNAVLNGTQVVNNPFWSSSDDNFFHSALATKIGIKVPKTAILPSKEHPHGTSSESMRNLVFPLEWDAVFKYIGFPAYLKPNRGNGLYNAYKVYNAQEFFSAYDLTGNTLMILQEAMEFEEYYRCYAIGKKYVRIMKYDPRKPLHLRYSTEKLNINDKLKSKLEKICIQINTALGFKFNAVEFAIKDGKPYATNFLDPIPNTEHQILHDENFEWLVNTTSDYLIELALKGKQHPDEYTWSTFLPVSKVKPIEIKQKRGRKPKISEITRVAEEI